MMHQDAKAELDRFHKDGLWFSEHYDELIEQYPDQWVAIFNKKVVGASPDPDQLFADLKTKGVPINHAFFKFMSTEEVNWAFPSLA